MSQEILLEKIESLKELLEEKFHSNTIAHEQINEHLRVLNGQVYKNSAFRQRGVVIIGILGVIGGTAVTTLVIMAINAIF